ncbi:MAG: molybdopterin-dependent oxidoreductase, partial [Actinobacteria bacterium]|nr:molybdopterin-dependent oxidoreductase [Actinomycetota bacterium]
MTSFFADTSAWYDLIDGRSPHHERVAVAAVDEVTAREATKKIAVDYEVLAPVSSIEQALLAPADEPIHEGTKGNIHRLAALEFGDVDEGFAVADVVREDVFFYEGSNHLAMEEHSATAIFA